MPDPSSVPSRRVALSAVLLGLILGAHTALETARDAMFLIELPVTWLPLAYASVAAAALATTALVERIRVRFARRRSLMVLSAILAVVAPVNGVFWWGLARTSTAGLFALYVWPGVAATTLLVPFWLWVHQSVGLAAGRRVYAFIGGGGLVGAVGGGLLATVLSETIAARDLLLVSGGVYLVAAMVALGASLRRVSPSPGASPPTSRAEAKLSETSPGFFPALGGYGRLVLALFVAVTVAATSADFVFKETIVGWASGAELTKTLGLFYAVSNGLALLVQTLVLPILLHRSSVMMSLAVLPVTLAAGGGAALLQPLVGAAMLRLDGALRHSAFSTASEFLYLPLSEARRQRLKSLVETVGKRGGQAFTSAVLLILLYAAPALSSIAVTLSASLVALAILYLLRRRYADAYRRRVRARASPTRAEWPTLGVDGLSSLVAALSAPKAAVVRAGMEVLAGFGKRELLPPLVLHHPDPDVVCDALGHLAGRREREVLPLLETLMARPEPRVRAEALRTACTYGPRAAARCLRSADGDQAPEVAATAEVARFTAEAWNSVVDRRELLDALTRGKEARLGIARSIHLLPDQAAPVVALRLLGAGDHLVACAAVRSIGRDPRAVHLRPLLQALLEPTTRDEACRALGRLPGSVVVPAIIGLLGDDGRPASERRHLPSVLASFPGNARWMTQRLVPEPDPDVRAALARAVVMARRRHRRERVDRRALSQFARQVVAEGRRARSAATTVAGIDPRRPAHRVARDHLVDILDARHRRAIDDLFAVLQVARPDEEFELLANGCTGTDPKLRGESRELLRHLLPSRLREPLLDLLRPRSAAVPPDDEDEVLTRLAGDRSPTVVALARVIRRASRCDRTMSRDGEARPPTAVSHHPSPQPGRR